MTSVKGRRPLLEKRECQRNLELMWLIGRLAPNFKTIADFRRDSGTGIRNVCRRFVVLCTAVKIDRFQQQVAQSIQRYDEWQGR